MKVITDCDSGRIIQGLFPNNIWVIPAATPVSCRRRACPPRTIPALRRARSLPSSRNVRRERSVPSEIGCTTNAIVVWRGKRGQPDQGLDVEDGHGRNHLFSNH
jgi:hypothetical protein